MPEAAHLTHEIEHSFALAGLVAGLLIGAAIAAATVATGGAALAVVVATVAGGASMGATLGKLVGRMVPGITTGILMLAPITVFINKLPAANTNSSSMCSGPPLVPVPHPNSMVAQGSSTVLICNGLAARKGDKLTCGATISGGSANVFIGGETAQVRDVASEVPQWLDNVVLALGLISGAGAIWQFGMKAVFVIGGSFAGGMGGHWLGGKIFGEGSVGQEFMALGGSLLGGGLAAKALPKIPCNGVSRRMGLADPVDPATGEVFDAKTDFSIPGLVPIEWRRYYLSSRWEKSLTGHGWHLCYEQWLEIAEGDTLRWKDDEGRDVYLVRPDIFSSYYDTREKLKVTHNHNEFVLHRYTDNLQYHFTPAAGHPSRFVLTRIVHTSGLGIALHWGYGGQLEALVNVAGERLAIAYGPEDCISKATLHLPGLPDPKVQVTYAYDERHNLAEVTDAEGGTLAMAYQQHLITSKTDKNGHTFTWQYDRTAPAARCTFVTGKQGYVRSRFEYGNNRTAYTNSLGYTAHYYNNGQGQITRIEDCEGDVKEWTYDDNQNPLIYTDELGGVTTYNYNEAGNLKDITHPDGTVVVFAYDREHRLIGHTNLYGQFSAYQYNEAGALQTLTLPDGHALLYGYDKRGRVRQTKSTQSGATIFEYDERDNLTAIKEEHGRQELRRYDACNRCTVTERGQIIENYTYDNLNRLTAVSSSTGQHTRLCYEGNDLVSRVTDTTGNLLLEYTPLGLLKKRVYNSSTLLFTYNTEDWLTRITNEKGEQYHFEYDRNGRIIAETGFDGRTTRYLRGRGGRLERIQKANGKTTEYHYNSLGRLERIQYDAEYWETFGYDRMGNLIKATNPFGDIELERDSLGRVCTERYNWGEVAIDSSYDAQGRLAVSHSNLGYSQQWQHNALGYLEATTALQGTRQWEARYRQDLYGFELERLLPGDAQVQWSRDAAGRPLAQKLLQGNSAQLHHTYQWQDSGQLACKRDHTAATQTDYSYNAQGYLTGSAQRSLNPRQVGSKMLYREADEAGNLYETKEKTDRQYGAGGRLLRRGRWHYEYDGDGNLREKYQWGTERPSFVVGGPPLRTKEQYWRYEWYGNGMLKKVVRPDKQEVLFTYDAFGRRLSKQVGTTLHKYVWRGDVLIHQWQEDSGDRTLVSEDGSLRVPVKHHFITWLYDNESFTPVGKIADGKAYSIISDYLGTPFAMLDEQGARVWEDEMDIWGRAKVKKGSAEDCPFRYQGQYEDIETGLYYNRFRYYDPEIGIYISQDPIRLLGGNKIYSYVHDTNTHIDKLGLSCVSKAKLSIQEQLSRGKNARVTVNNKTEAETLLRDVTSGPGHKGGYMNTTEPGTFSPQSGASDWLPRPSGSKRGTYHWDEYNPNASAGDHAIEGSHLQIHTFEGKIIRIFY